MTIAAFVPWLGIPPQPEADSLEDTRDVERAESEGMLSPYGRAVDALTDAE